MNTTLNVHDVDAIEIRETQQKETNGRKYEIKTIKLISGNEIFEIVAFSKDSTFY